MSESDMAMMMFCVVVWAYAIYSGLNRIAEAIDAFGRKTISVKFDRIDVFNHE